MPEYLFVAFQDRNTQEHTTHEVDFPVVVLIHLLATIWFHSSPLCVHNLFRCDFGSAYLESLGGSPLAHPSEFRFGNLLTFLVNSFLSGGLGAIEVQILSILSPLSLLSLLFFLVFSFVWPGTRH